MSSSVYKIITDKIISKLREGIIVWDKPWVGDGCEAFNRISKKKYSLLNQMLLSNNGEYATRKQWEKLGGVIKNNERPEIVTFWKIYDKETGGPGEKSKDTIERIPVLRYYKVFHISQVDGVAPLPIRRFNNKLNNKIDSYVNNYLERENIKFIQMRIDKSFYSDDLNMIVLPLLEQFKSSNHYYCTLLHEIIHSTGGVDRLNRFGSNTKRNYSKEELVAEIGSAFLANMFGIKSEDSITNSAAYIQSWISVLENNERYIVYASSKAEKAIEYFLINLNN